MLVMKMSAARLGALAIGAFATGARAIGALATGMFAIGRLVVGRLNAGRVKIRSLEIDELTVGKIIIRESSGSRASPPEEPSIGSDPPVCVTRSSVRSNPKGRGNEHGRERDEKAGRNKE